MQTDEVLAPVCTEYIPAGHFAQVDEPEVEYVPAGQTLHTDDEVALVTAEYVPLGQGVQVDDDVAAVVLE